MSHIILAVFDAQSYELLIYLCCWGDAARDEMEGRIIVCRASFFLPFPPPSLFFSLYTVIAGSSRRGRDGENSSTALQPGRVDALSCINGRGDASLVHVYLRCFTPILHLIIFTALAAQIEK